MSIELHCPKCAKLIRAPEDAGGKRGKCPYCKESVYIPLPPSDDEVIAVAPIDEEEERREREMRREAIDYIAHVGHAKDVPPESAMTSSPGAGSGGAMPPGRVVDIGAEVDAFLAAMRDSKLEDADRAVRSLKSTGSRAKDYVEGMLLDEMPIAVDGLPPALVKGFLKTLSERLS